MPSGTIRCAKCSPTIPTLPGRSATTILSFCADLRTWRKGATTRKRQCLVGIVSERKVAECSQSTHQECRWECSHAGDTNRCSKQDLSVRLVWRLSRGVNLLSWYESRVPISVGNGHRPTPTAQDMLSWSCLIGLPASCPPQCGNLVGFSVCRVLWLPSKLPCWRSHLSHDVTAGCLGLRLVGVVVGTPDRCRC